MYEDLFKSELGIEDDKVLIDCPHCDHAITKSEVLAKAKGTTTVAQDNKKLKEGKSGANGKTPVRAGGTPGREADHTNPLSKGDDEDTEKCDSSMNKSDAAPAPAPAPSGPIIRGSAFVQYVDTGHDEYIAKAIEEGGLGQGSISRPPIDKYARR